ncbi:PREDICTED: uncharacterized protein LOC102026758 isoform X2 [Chinchilla lanigera]|uniref:uncharacterized protein LOC102026758 isoform X2 n=1 Tax=Chinchilla lanigera TaxID=34839 RepID=UPI00038F170C|nr:PREDICTED: uncharacterized protein LOC102026758 isoform X2 [Chinchilla lanigera]
MNSNLSCTTYQLCESPCLCLSFLIQGMIHKIAMRIITALSTDPAVYNRLPLPLIPAWQADAVWATRFCRWGRSHSANPDHQNHSCSRFECVCEPTENPVDSELESGTGLRACISDQLPGDAGVGDPRTTFYLMRIYFSPKSVCKARRETRVPAPESTTKAERRRTRKGQSPSEGVLVMKTEAASRTSSETLVTWRLPGRRRSVLLCSFLGQRSPCRRAGRWHGPRAPGSSFLPLRQPWPPLADAPDGHRRSCEPGGQFEVVSRACPFFRAVASRGRG